MQVTLLDIALAVVAIISSFVSAWGYTHRKQADAQLIEVKQTADDAKEKAQQFGDLTGAIRQLAESVSTSNERGAAERDGWRKSITDTTTATQQLAINTGQVKESVRNVHEDVAAVARDITVGREKVIKEVKATMEETENAIIEALKAEVVSLNSKVDQVLVLLRENRAVAVPENVPVVEAPVTVIAPETPHVPPITLSKET